MTHFPSQLGYRWPAEWEPQASVAVVAVEFGGDAELF